jgi:tRNA pseudouridine-54 N-methylase
MAGHVVFVTGDHDDLTKKRERLRAEAGIVVMTTQGAVALVLSA